METHVLLFYYPVWKINYIYLRYPEAKLGR